jgi:hypothetical protein
MGSLVPIELSGLGHRRMIAHKPGFALFSTAWEGVVEKSHDMLPVFGGTSRVLIGA